MIRQAVVKAAKKTPAAMPIRKCASFRELKEAARQRGVSWGSNFGVLYKRLGLSYAQAMDFESRRIVGSSRQKNWLGALKKAEVNLRRWGIKPKAAARASQSKKYT